MKRFKRLLPPVLALLVVACSDAMSPLANSTDLEVPSILAGKGKPGGGGETTGSGDPAAYVMQQASAAPILETYQISFWAVKGEEVQVQVNYDLSDKEPKPFVKFTVPSRSLYKHPDGTLLANGDSVLITATIDPVNFAVDFQPSGLLFNKRWPARIVFKYTDANFDIDRDGDIDADDDAILQSGLTVFHSEDGAPDWQPVTSFNDYNGKKIEGEVTSFSGYAVSW